MSQEDQPKPGEIVQVKSGLLAHGAKGLAERVLKDLDSQGSWRCQATLHGHTGRVDHLAVNRDGTLLASGGEDGTIRLWRLPEGLLLGAVDAYTGPVIWLNEDGSSLRWEKPAQRVECLEMSQDNQFLLSGGIDGTVRLWTLPSFGPLKTIKVSDRGVTSLALSPDGKLLVTGCGNNMLRLWSLPEGELIKTIETPSSNGNINFISHLVASPDGSLLASGDSGGGVQLWKLPEGNLLSTLQGPHLSINSLSMSPDGRLLAGCGWDEFVYLWTLPEGKLSLLKGHNRRSSDGKLSHITNLTMNLSGELLASAGGRDSTVRLWRLPAGVALKTLEVHLNPYSNCLVISPNDHLLACSYHQVGTNEYGIHLWQLPEGKALCALEHPDLIGSLAMTPDSRTLISGGGDGTVRLWGSYL